MSNVNPSTINAEQSQPEMRFFIDENLSPGLTGVCHAADYDATCPRDRGLLGLLDPDVAALCLQESRVLVTINAGDFRQLAASSGFHPGLITMPSLPREQQIGLLNAAIAYIEQEASAAGEAAADFMLNRVVEVEWPGACQHYDLPER